MSVDNATRDYEAFYDRFETMILKRKRHDGRMFNKKTQKRNLPLEEGDAREREFNERQEA